MRPLKTEPFWSRMRVTAVVWEVNTDVCITQSYGTSSSNADDSVELVDLHMVNLGGDELGMRSNRPKDPPS